MLLFLFVGMLHAQEGNNRTIYNKVYEKSFNRYAVVPLRRNAARTRREQ